MRTCNVRAGKGVENWQVPGCLAQDTISQPAGQSPGSAGLALGCQHQPQDQHRALCQLSPGTLGRVLARALDAPPPRMNASWAGCPDGTTKQLCSGTPQEQSESHCPVVACPTSPALPAPWASGLGHSVTGTWDRPAELNAESPEGQSS